MPKYLDYARLMKDDTPLSVQIALITVCTSDFERRLRAFFPEFFTEDRPRTPVHIGALKARYMFLKNHFGPGDGLIEDTLDWFGIKMLTYVGGAENPSEKDIRLPDGFVLEREGDYIGLDDKPWIARLPDKKGNERDVLVLEVLPLSHDGGEYYLFGIPATAVIFEELPGIKDFMQKY
jgi:hypothetical protein